MTKRPRDDDAWERCVRWVVASGGAVGAVTLGDDAGVRGVVAAAGGIEAGAAVLEIPLRCCVLAADVNASPVGSVALQGGNQTAWCLHKVQFHCAQRVERVCS